jgi:hypothetical protein
MENQIFFKSESPDLADNQITNIKSLEEGGLLPKE